jgi:hypothetical protein
MIPTSPGLLGTILEGMDLPETLLKLWIISLTVKPAPVPKLYAWGVK